MTTEADRWATQQGKDARRRAMRRAGDGWALLGPDLREALIAAEIVSLVLGQANETMVNNPALAHIAAAARVAFAREAA